LKIQDGGVGHLENHRNRDICATALPIFTKFGWFSDAKWLLQIATAPTVEKFEFQKSQDAGRPQF